MLVGRDSITRVPLRVAITAARRVPPLGRLLRSVARRSAGAHHVGAVVVLFNERGEVLLARHALRGGWALPGGWVRPHEEPAAAVVRELREETALEVIPGVLVGAESHAEATRGRGPSGITIAFMGTLAPSHARPVSLSPELEAIEWTPASEAAQRLGRFERGCLAVALQWRERHPPEHNAASTSPE